MWPKLEQFTAIQTDIPDWILVVLIIISTAFAILMIYFAAKAHARAKGLIASANELRNAHKELRETFKYVVYALARAAEAHDAETGNHILRVGEFCAILAEELGQPEEFIQEIRVQSALHDIGKIHVSGHILHKKDNLSEEEWQEMKKHPFYGGVIIGDHKGLAIGKNIALTHHERFDGSGYPCGLKGSQIPLEGQIINLADQYEALRSSRSYKPGYDHETAYRIITEGDGKTKPAHFSEEVLNAFKKRAGDFEAVYQKLKDTGSREPEGNFCPPKPS